MVKIFVPKPITPCNVREVGGNIVGKVTTYVEFQELVNGISPIPLSILVSERCWSAIDPVTDKCMYCAMFNDND